ncbi:TfoX/Sxy family protein [Phreatobacter aquaticus]|uniref:TfoX/Sxy family protein n=1 Tax=Phreatobacter aquaticus TaxID=2570229 RepID=A0A4D7QM84_9HYPH|nr:TfoX/Sxy family protein [Phreatobacter aquaticus]QCK87631.1 TfoX/Sxy family protein [Phreatobacter aquaticus]
MAGGTFDPDVLIDLFQPFARVTTRRMFSGFAVYREGIVVALALRDTIYLRCDGETASAFEAEGLLPFTYRTQTGERSLGSYRRMPDICFDDEDALVVWARRAWEAALRTPTKTRKRRTKPA